MTNNFEDVLNECINRILKGESIERCLRDHPEHAAELEPLLQTALAARKASSVEPSSEFRAEARYRFYSQLREAEQKRQKRGISFFGQLR